MSGPLATGLASPSSAAPAASASSVTARHPVVTGGGRTGGFISCLWQALGFAASACLLMLAQRQIDSEAVWLLLATAWVPWGLVLPRHGLACWLEASTLLALSGLPLLLGAASAIGLPPSVLALLLLSAMLALPFAGCALVAKRWGQGMAFGLALGGFWLLEQLKDLTVANWTSYADPLGESVRVAPVLALFGAGGTTLLLLLTNAALVTLLRQSRWRRLALLPFPLLALTLPWWLPQLVPMERAAVGGVSELRLALLTPYREEQINQMSDQALAEGLLQAYAALDPAQVDLVVMPQSGLEGLALGESETLRQLLRQVATRGIPLLAGAHPPAPDAPGALLTTFNSGMLITPGLARQLLAMPHPAQVQLSWQHKRYLVPVGEYDPWWLRWWPGSSGLPRLHVMLPGQESHPLTLTLPASPGSGMPGRRTLRLGVMLCYDSYFPDVARTLRAEGAQLLVVLSSDMAFHGSALSRQGLRTARLRGMEQELPMARIAWSAFGSGVYTAQGQPLTPLPAAGSGELTGGAASADGLKIYRVPLASARRPG